MVCKHFYENTDSCILSRHTHFRVQFRRTNVDNEALEAQGVDTWVDRFVASFVSDQFDVCPLQGESDGETTRCPFYEALR